MKKNIYTITLVIALTMPLLCNANSNKSSQTFMRIRPIYYNLASEMQVRDYALQIEPMFQESRNAFAGASYYLINCQQKLSVAGDATTTNLKNNRDVRAEWLGLPANFFGTLSISPKQKQYGVMFRGHYALKSANIHRFFDGMFFEVAAPIVKASNNIHFCQENIQNPGTAGPNSTGITNLQQAFASMTSGRMVNGDLCKTEIPEVRCTMGSNFLNQDDFKLVTYSSILVPTGKKTTPQYLFNPTLGPNGHWGLAVALALEVPLHEPSSKYKLQLFINAEDIYLIRAHEYRLFDLKNESQNNVRQWSRYLQYRRMLANGQGDPEYTVSGTNLLALKADIHPYSSADFSTGLKLAIDKFSCEAGYNIWSVAHEKVVLTKASCNPNGLTIENFGIAGTGSSSASLSTINNQAPNDVDTNGDPLFVPVSWRDIDTNSASGRGGWSQRIHVACAYAAEKAGLGLGFYWETPHSNYSLGNIGCWAKAGLDF